MSTDSAIGSSEISRPVGAITGWKRHWPALTGFAVLAAGTVASLASQTWGTELGSHGPIVLASGAWLLWRSGLLSGTAVARGPTTWSLVLALPALAVYAFGRAYDYISVEAGAAYLLLLLLAWMLLGWPRLVANFFPFVYLAFLVPPPGWLVDRATGPLQIWISKAVTELLQLLNYPIEQFGVTLYIAQYQLLVEQACSGMNSIVGLTAISLFYIHMMHGASPRYMLFLMAAILPIAMVANFIRVLALVLITYYFGDAAAQGFLHGTTGVALFAVAVLLIFALDKGVQRWVLKTRKD